MPRNRRTQAPTQTTSTTSDTPNTPSTTTPSTTTQGERKMGLTQEQIAQLLSKSRTKGVYVKYLGSFIESAEDGICVNDTWADLKDKKASTLKTGFENAKASKNAPEGSDNVTVISNEDQVYLIKQAASGLEAAPAEEVAA